MNAAIVKDATYAVWCDEAHCYAVQMAREAGVGCVVGISGSADYGAQVEAHCCKVIENNGFAEFAEGRFGLPGRLFGRGCASSAYVGVFHS
ncbi:hypothetical protein [Paraburkholderia tropica]|uniref:hypothetical protein n=1 Tax=Paraburkholderia tropica TaxID=92647 RepID=UPI002AB12274|nr:hypothetical protein [Paraburkholderia tropica]